MLFLPILVNDIIHTEMPTRAGSVLECPLTLAVVVIFSPRHLVSFIVSKQFSFAFFVVTNVCVSAVYWSFYLIPVNA